MADDLERRLAAVRQHDAVHLDTKDPAGEHLFRRALTARAHRETTRRHAA